MNKIYLTLIIITFFMGCNNDLKNNDYHINNDSIQSAYKIKLSKIKYDIIKTESGWGYDIIVDDKIYIHQKYIPAINGKESFTSPKAAKKVADYAVKKFVKTKKLPVISYQELDSLNVL